MRALRCVGAGAPTALSLLALVSTVALLGCEARTPDVTRTELQRHDLSAPGREVVQVRVDLAPGATAPDHTHPGEEIIYVLEGTFTYVVGHAPPIRLSAGDVLYVPAGTPHSATNVGRGRASELATYIAIKGQPLSAPAER